MVNGLTVNDLIAQKHFKYYSPILFQILNHLNSKKLYLVVITKKKVWG